MHYMWHFLLWRTVTAHLYLRCFDKWLRTLSPDSMPRILFYGGIRDSSLLVHLDGKLEMKLIDFDLGGKEGEVHYPALINNRTVHRPPNAVGGQLIRQSTIC